MKKRVWLVLMSLFMLAFSSQVMAKVTLKFAMIPSVTSNEYKAATDFKKFVESTSKGDIVVKLYPDAQLGDDREALEQLQAGVLDMTFAETGRMGLWNKKAEIFQMAYVFDNYAHLQKALKTPAGMDLINEFRTSYNWRLLGNAYNGTRQTSSNKPIKSIADMKGMKLRVPNAKANLNFAKYSGASPTPMAFSEVYLALQTNAVDGQENPLSTIKATKFYEVQKYIAMTNHILNDANYIISEVTWKKLTPAQQKIVADGVTKAAALHTSLFQKDEKDLIAFFKKEGLTITTPDTKAFKTAMKPAFDEYLKANGTAGKKLYDAINSVK